MEAVLLAFCNELSDLKRLLVFNELEVKLLGSFAFDSNLAETSLLLDLSNSLKEFPLSKRQFNYNGIIISLYGAFERFVENCLFEFADALNKTVRVYSNLPELVTRHHFSLSLSLISKIEQSRYDGPLRKEDVIGNLHSCMNTHSDYRLNVKAFTQHTANFRSQVIDECFNCLGVSSISHKILNERDFQQYLLDELGVGKGGELNSIEALYFVNDLAERRNDVAHGVPSEMLQNDILLDYINYMERFGSAMVSVLSAQLLEIEIREWGRPFGEITDLFDQGRVICFKTLNVPFKVGDWIIGRNKNKIIKSKIESIQLEGATLTEIDEEYNYEVGVKISDAFKKKL